MVKLTGEWWAVAYRDARDQAFGYFMNRNDAKRFADSDRSSAQLIVFKANTYYD